VAIAIKLEDGGPVLFRQVRVGRHGRPFWILKFRTMTAGADRRGPAVTRRGDPRVTRIGGVLRNWKLDELPQLVNVLRGDMSLVGPRPELRRYVRQFADDFRDIHSVRPGLTDLASISYRHEADWLAGCSDPEAAYVRQVLPDKIRLAKLYVRRASLGYDLWLVLCTLLVLLVPEREADGALDRLGRHRRLRSFVMQAVLCAAAYLAAWGLRFDGVPPPELARLALASLPFVVSVRLLWLRPFHLDCDLWRFVGLQELANIVAATGLASATLALAYVAAYPAPLPHVPRGVLLLDPLLALAALAGARLARRVYREYGGRVLSARRVLVIGANESTERILRDLNHRSRQPYRFVGLVGNGHTQPGLRLHDVPFVGGYDELDEVLERTAPDEVLMVASAVPDERRRELARRCRRAERPVRFAPDVPQLDGPLRVPAALQPDIDELLPRDPVHVDLARLREAYAGRVVLVTGAGGSIGSELCRQLAACAPSRLVLFEQHERSLYDIDRELRVRCPDVRIVPVLGDVRDAARVQDVFSELRPECVFHAAACKHVPMMEHNPSEAFKTNVLGTRTVAEAADRGGAATFVLISTDKAVEPVSIMGATKRMAELVVQGVARASRTHFHTVRFGNVLESSGSVVPLFREQIERGGPVTVTHPDVTRWFMTVPEAVSLILEVRAMGEGGEVFVLDMGRPMRVLDLARALIRQYGLEPDKDVPIVFTGLRPGERLFEKLFNDHEVVWKTPHQRILKAVDLAARGNGGSNRQEEFQRLWRLVAHARCEVPSQELERHAAELDDVQAYARSQVHAGAGAGGA
jgi:FlaA1/EpsC-like NDP-sugar epimerase/lipopolysaccharide/colanic/teichoic acid biosynthesis glycosyltransferase